jgi:hypothetical protein
VTARVRLIVAFFLVMCSMAGGTQEASGQVPSPAPTNGATGTSGPGAFGVEVNTHKPGAHRPGHASAVSAPAISTSIDCGPPAVVGHEMPLTNPNCAVARVFCDVQSTAQLPTPTVTDTVTVTRFPDGRIEIAPHCRVHVGKRAARITDEMLRDEAEKLVPHPKIGVAPPGGVTLVNIETVLWVDTLPDRFLGTVTLLGHRVDLRAHVEQVHWDFGDGSTDTTSTPGEAYTHDDPCRTVDCPHYFGHTYIHTGRVTITAELTWTGEFRVDGGTWQPITGAVAAPATATSVHVKEARGILAPNP